MYKKIMVYSGNSLNSVPKKWAALLVCCYGFCGLYAQKNIDLHTNNRVILNAADGNIIYAELAKENSKRRVNNDVFYYWYSANDIKRTKGGYAGKLLHGQYTKFYSNKNLKTQGRFKNGIMVGQWKSWHQTGQLSEILRWKRKGTRAKFEIFDEQGELVKQGMYRNEKYDGVILEIRSGKVIKTKYTNGIEKVNHSKVKSDSLTRKASGKKKIFGFVKWRRHKNDSLTTKLNPTDTVSSKKVRNKKVKQLELKKSESTKMSEAKPVDSGKDKKRRKKRAPANEPVLK